MIPASGRPIVKKSSQGKKMASKRRMGVQLPVAFMSRHFDSLILPGQQFGEGFFGALEIRETIAKSQAKVHELNARAGSAKVDSEQ
jgi:hypothetical protein